MELLRNASKYFFGNPTSQESLIEIAQGELYLVRPHSPKGYSELIFRDCNCAIRRTGQQFQYQLALQRAYQEGEEELEEEDDDGGELATPGLSNPDKDEKTFLLDEALKFRCEKRAGEGGEWVFGWTDLSGDEGDVYEFVCDFRTQEKLVKEFEIVAAECQYERKHRQPHENASEADLLAFYHEQPVPDAGTSPVRRSPSSSQTLPSRASAVEMAPSTPAKAKSPAKQELAVAPPARKNPESQAILASITAELHLYNPTTSAFDLQDEKVTATVMDLGSWKYWLRITGKTRDWLGQEIVDEVNPVFNFEYLSFIFNHYTDDGSGYSWLLRVKDQDVLDTWQHGVMQALWEHDNQIKWAKNVDQDYVLDAFNDLNMEDAPDVEDVEEEEEEDDDEQRSEHYDSDESQEDVEVRAKDGNVNSALEVGQANDRTFVVRGSNLGVFKNSGRRGVEFSTNISNIKTPGKDGKLFTPSKVMLHMRDRNLVMQNPNDPNSLFRMDVESGKVVDEWKMGENINLQAFAPGSKFAQTTDEQTLIGLGKNQMFKIDPRLKDVKVNQDPEGSDFKQYAANTKAFSAAATTEKGYIAVASVNGDIRLYDRLGIRAKSNLPTLGEAIIGIDVSADGRWVLATCKNALLLIDNLQKEGKSVGKLGFEKGFGKDDKPKPRRLALTPNHVAEFMAVTKKPVSFTKAHFNTGEGKHETTIVTSTGPYVVTWSMKKILKGLKDPYSIRRHEDDVVADNFRYGTDKSLVAAFKHNVEGISKGQLKRPTRESILGSPGRSSFSTPQRQSGAGRVSALRRSDIVDSPY
ncbi:hypothetical protein FH972_023325 [Carpinus fangiana]|uniref:Vacuolar import/degradation Vid27 C-terminal domain-containing protein n=1 Tax=Carpinus fangiana TaxID=176857 RepID=A0A5N6KV80_9ROSI|nr:hypothetical protein FH972_023325 [Carpinus fangiana]